MFVWYPKCRILQVEYLYLLSMHAQKHSWNIDIMEEYMWRVITHPYLDLNCISPTKPGGILQNLLSAMDVIIYQCP